MKYIFILLIVCLSLSCSSQIRDENKVHEIENSYENGFSLEQMKALYFLNERAHLNLKLFTKSYDAIDIDSLLLQLMNTDNFKKNLKGISTDQKKELLKISNQWIQVKNVLDFAIDNSDYLDYLEFFYNDSRTKKIFNIYLKNPNQDWGSLSSFEQYEVYYQIINEISLQDSKNKLNFISDFYNKMKLGYVPN